MKTILLLVSAACLLLPSCATKGQPRIDRLDPQKLAKLGNIALTVAEATGGVNAKQAALVRTAGALLLNDGSESRLAAISEAAIVTAVKEGSLTQEEADLLREVGTVALKAPDPGPTNPLLPPPAH